MSLQVWLPLNGTIENKGLGTVTKESGTATFDKDSKIGRKALNLKQSVNFLCPQIANLRTFSICFWGMAESSSTLTSNQQDVFGFVDVRSDGTTGTFRWETCYNLTSWQGNGIHWHDNVTNALVDGSYAHNTSKEEWVHCCVVFNAEVGKIYSYSNGVLKQIHEHLGGSFNSAGRFKIGETNNIEGRIQDVRIYDHALSPKEVKEISKGLCLHYRLSGHGCENLITNSQQLQDKFYTYTSSWEKSYKNGIWTATCTAAGIGGPHTPIFPKTTDKIGKTYTFSCLIRSSRNLKLNIGHECGGVRYFDITPSWQRITNTWVFTDASSQSIRWYALNGVAWNVGDWFQVKDFKIEEGDKATPWIPNSSDSLYSSLGYNSVVEPDCSGFGNDGVKVGDISCNGDTARYITSYKFDSGKDYIKSTYTNNMETFTVSYWIKPSSLSGRYATVASNFNNDTRCWFGVNTENSGCWFFNHQYCQTSGTITNDKWHHCVFVFDKGISKWYVDGKEAQLSKNTLTDTSIQFSNFTIGNSYAGTEYIRDNYCGLSDFRIYATALSAEDVLDLYQTGASIDNGGNAWAYEYKEVE